MKEIIALEGHLIALNEVDALIPHAPSFEQYKVVLRDGSSFALSYKAGYGLHKQIMKRH